MGAQHRQQLGARSPGHRRLQEQPTHGGVESPAHGARAARARDCTCTCTSTSTRRTSTGECRAEESGRPERLERSRLGRPIHLSRPQRTPRPHDRELREEGVGQVVPRNDSDDAVHARVGRAEHDRERPTVGRPHHADVRVAGRIQEHVTAGGEQTHEGAGIGDLVCRVVEVDPASRRAETPGGVAEHEIAPGGEVTASLDQVGLAAAEAVGQQDRRPGFAVLAEPAWTEDGHVQRHRRPVRLRAHRDAQRLFDGRSRRSVRAQPGSRRAHGRCREPGRRPRHQRQHHGGEQGRGGAADGIHEPERNPAPPEGEVNAKQPVRVGSRTGCCVTRRKRVSVTIRRWCRPSSSRRPRGQGSAGSTCG
ncbi:MAG: hypothetical protein BWY91_01054 [bacterium ADurb.BinA028]|nr:MAG: hypothetical protein BWY91_01054 [bacterium ADurb.BinA028]